MIPIEAMHDGRYRTLVFGAGLPAHRWPGTAGHEPGFSLRQFQEQVK